MGKGRAFLEILSSALNEDYRFPILEVFVFLYAVAAVVFTGPATLAISSLGFGASCETLTFVLVSSLTEFPLFVFVVLLLKNIAYGIGNDLDKGTIQTLFSYPLKRRSILTAKLMASLGVAVLLFLGVQTFVLFVIASDIVSSYLTTLLLSYAGILSFPLLIAGLVLTVTLILKRGSLALVAGIILYFGFEVFSFSLLFFSISENSDIPLKIYAIINPHFALQEYYTPGRAYPSIEWSNLWTVSFTDALLYIGASYVLVILIFTFAYLYFERRLEI